MFWQNFSDFLFNFFHIFLILSRFWTHTNDCKFLGNNLFLDIKFWHVQNFLFFCHWVLVSVGNNLSSPHRCSTTPPSSSGMLAWTSCRVSWHPSVPASSMPSWGCWLCLLLGECTERLMRPTYQPTCEALLNLFASLALNVSLPSEIVKFPYHIWKSYYKTIVSTGNFPLKTVKTVRLCNFLPTFPWLITFQTSCQPSLDQSPSRHCRRRVLLLSSMVLCAVSQVVLIVSLRLLPTASWAMYCAIFALMGYITMYAIGLGPIPFMIATGGHSWYLSATSIMKSMSS